MAKTHNKKRNVGLLFEQLVKYSIVALLENDRPKARKSLEILQDGFKKGTALYSEYKLFKALVATKADSKLTAERVMAEARRVAQRHDHKKLNEEQSALIKKINYELSNSLYDVNVPHYRKYATAQRLINNWRAGSNDIGQMVKFENGIIEEMCMPAAESLIEVSPDNANELTLQIMERKFSNIYDGDLTDVQKDLIRSYVFERDYSRATMLMENIKKDALRSLTSYMKDEDNDHLNEKYDRVQKNIQEISTKDVDDISIKRSLVVAELIRETRQNV